MDISLEPGSVGGRLRAPASKSAMQRALAIAALAGGQSIIRNPSFSADALAAIEIVKALGGAVAIPLEGGEKTVLVDGGFERKDRQEKTVLNCGESGLSMRMFSAIAALHENEVELHAEGSLKKRSLLMVEKPLLELGVQCASDAGFAPLRVRGPLKPGRYSVDGSESSQFITGLLIALPLAGGASELRVKNPSSGGYLELTIEIMRHFGISVEELPGSGPDEKAWLIPSAEYRHTEYRVEGDWSGAAFLFVAAAIGGSGIIIDGLEEGSTQPDMAIAGIVRAAGASASYAEGSWSVRPAPTLSAFSFDAGNCPDLFPPLAVLASACRGVSVIRGVQRLRGKESDRAMALQTEFARLGVRIDIDGDAMHIEGRGGKLKSASIDAHGDHRIAMAGAIASLMADGPVTIRGAQAVNKSWPGFFEDLAGLR